MRAKSHQVAKGLIVWNRPSFLSSLQQISAQGIRVQSLESISYVRSRRTLIEIIELDFGFMIGDYVRHGRTKTFSDKPPAPCFA
jgi:hypothetical protein